MSIYNHLINILYTTSCIYIFIAFFRLNPKYNKKLVLTVIIVLNVFLTFLTNSGISMTLYSMSIVIADLLLFYFFYNNSCINNLIKINLISILLIIVNLITGLVTSFSYYIITGHSANLYATNVADGFELFTFALSMIVWILIIAIMDNQFGNWVFSLSGLTQRILLIIIIFVPFFYMPFMSWVFSNTAPENRNIIFFCAVCFLFLILLSVFITALFQRKQEIKQIQYKIDYQNAQYEKYLTLQIHMRMLKHDLNNFLALNSPEFQNKIITYCDEIEMDLEELR